MAIRVATPLGLLRLLTHGDEGTAALEVVVVGPPSGTAMVGGVLTDMGEDDLVVVWGSRGAFLKPPGPISGPVIW